MPLSPEPEKVSLFIVEDDLNIRYLMEAAASRMELFDSITSFVDGEAAWTALQHAAPHAHPDLIMSDLSMPRMTGIQLIRAIKADAATRHIPIAIVTSSDLPHDRDDAMRAGACAFVHKPYGLESFTRLLNEMVARHATKSAAVQS